MIRILLAATAIIMSCLLGLLQARTCEGEVGLPIQSTLYGVATNADEIIVEYGLLKTKVS